MRTSPRFKTSRAERANPFRPHDEMRDSRGQLKTPTAPVPTGPRSVESETAKKPEHSDHHQHCAECPGDTEAHAAEEQEDDQNH